LPASAVNPGLPGFDNSFAPFFTNQFGNGISSTALNQLLIQLQFELTQILPVVAGINNSFDFTASGTTSLRTNGIFGSAGVASPTSPGSIQTTTSGNASGLLSSSSAGNFGTSLGQDLSGIIGGRANSLGGSSTALSGGTSPAITPNTSVPVTTFGTVGATNGLAFMSTRDVLRALLLLQDDVERMLPLVNALNGGNAANLNTLITNNLGVVTNGVFVNGTGTVRGTATTTTRSTTTLTPTGR